MDSKSIPQSGEIISIRKKLPRGTLAHVAKQYGLSWTAVKDVAEGKIDRPDIYRSLLQRAEEIHKIQNEKEVLKAENREMVKTIYHE